MNENIPWNYQPLFFFLCYLTFLFTKKVEHCSSFLNRFLFASFLCLLFGFDFDFFFFVSRIWLVFFSSVSAPEFVRAQELAFFSDCVQSAHPATLPDREQGRLTALETFGPFRPKECFFGVSEVFLALLLIFFFLLEFSLLCLIFSPPASYIQNHSRRSKKVSKYRHLKFINSFFNLT